MADIIIAFPKLDDAKILKNFCFETGMMSVWYAIMVHRLSAR